MCLAVIGGRLVSGILDGTAKVWRMEATVAAWRCGRTLEDHGAAVCCLATWRDKMASGSADQTIRVWDLQEGS